MIEMRLMEAEAGTGSLMKQHEKREERQVAKVVGAVEEMTDEVKRMRVGQSEMALLTVRAQFSPGPRFFATLTIFLFKTL